MESKRQLIDSLTSHISLYNSKSPSSSSSNPNPRSSILKWFSSLTPQQRQSHLTVVDRSFTQLLIQLESKLRSNGHGFFIVLPDIPSSSSNPNLPSFCFRKSHGLSTRISQFSKQEKRIRESVQLFNSKEGENYGSSCCSCLDSVTVTVDFVQNVDAFVEAMDGVSNGDFLRGEESVLLGSSDWVELNWLKVKGYYSLEAFVANRLELALRLSWLHSNVGKKRGVKLKEKSASAVAGVAANVYWRKKGCVDWWMNLDDQMKLKVVRIILGKAARFLTHDVLYGRSSGVEDELQTSSQDPWWHQEPVPPNKLSSVTYKFNRLLILCEISTILLAFQHEPFDDKRLFFSSLESVITISDRILRKLRGLLMIISLDFTKLELLEDLNSTKSTKKPKEKLVSSKKGKTREAKKSIPGQKSSNSTPDRPVDDGDKLDIHATQETDLRRETPSPERNDRVVNGTVQSTSKKSKRARKKHKKDSTSKATTTKSTSVIPNNTSINNDTNSDQPGPSESNNIETDNIKSQNIDHIGGVNAKETETRSSVSAEPTKVTYQTVNEWPSAGPQLSFVNPHLPATTDRLHLDVGHNWQNHFHGSGFMHTVHQVRNPPVENGRTEVHPRPIPMSLDWPPMVHNINNTQYFGEEDFAISGMDYSQYFGGGVMYWDSSDHPVTGFSRPPSLSSDDSSWAWREADMNRTVDDMVAFSSSYSTNGLTSPSPSICSPFDPIGYVIPGEVAGKVFDENVSVDIEAKTGDLFPYPILRPIIIPNISRDRSREFKRSHDHKSPCVPPSRREDPPVKRPPSPVVLCVPRAPVGDSRKRGFPTVRSGSSSPRHWGVKGWFHDGINFDESCGSEVVWPSWQKKNLSARPLWVPCDQEHPDLAVPLQPPELPNCSTRKPALLLLHDEIDSFCKRVAGVNVVRKPYINWAVKRVARSLQVLWPRSRTNIFGSNATGLSLPTSDVDLVVCLPPVRNLEPIKEAGILEGRNGIKETCLQHAARYLANQEWVKNDSLKIVENTAIPIIMLVVEVPCDLIGFSKNDPDHDIKSIRIDISFKAPSHTGLQTTELVKELTEQFPAATPLALVLKQFLADRSLDQSYSGGLSSYCLILLITRFLQHEHHYGRPINQNFGGLLMDFFYFFGNVFDPRQMRISVQGSGVYINRERGYSIDPIYIDDPLFPANNVGRNCFRIHQCIKAFADAYSILEEQIVSVSETCDTSNGSLSVKLLPQIIPSIGSL